MTAQMIIIHSDEKIDFSLRGSKLFKILEKHGISNLSVQEKEFSGLSANNLSRAKFSKFCKDSGFKRLGARNAFEFNGKVYGFSVVQGDKVECRQFGENYDGLVCSFKGGKTKWYSRQQLVIGEVTRIGPDGTKYFNVEGEI
jgi:hypothetical protein